MPDLPMPSPLAKHWTLDPSWVFLNHGSFGATPRAVLEEQTRWRGLLEAEPVAFFVEHHEGVMDEVRAALAGFVGCDAADLALIPNASTGVATVAANLRLNPGDEILISAHEYPACQNSLRQAAARHGAKVTYANIPFPCPSPDAVVQAYLDQVTPRTRLALVSHVTSPTGLVLPVETLVKELAAFGVDTLVDGAHAPGMVPTVNLRELGAAYYTANCHKWICSPKGSAFLWVRPDKQAGFRPLVLSNNAEKPRPGRSQFLTEFDYQGTSDYTQAYSIPKAIEFMGREIGAALGGGGDVLAGWQAVMRHNRELCLRGRDVICKRLGIAPPVPDSMIGSICTMALPSHDEARQAKLAARPSKYHDALQDALLAKHKIQVPVWGLAGRPERFVRISAQVYNAMAQYEYLAEALAQELKAERGM
ncbi:MAG: aminotransferase class V-fold PLP-dependent enzyme [Phycisphaerales bacterium]|jgi:isopenicillin-N epimerase